MHIQKIKLTCQLFTVIIGSFFSFLVVTLYIQYDGAAYNQKTE